MNIPVTFTESASNAAWILSWHWPTMLVSGDEENNRCVGLADVVVLLETTKARANSLEEENITRERRKGATVAVVLMVVKSPRVR